MQQVSKDLPKLKTLISSALHNKQASIPDTHRGWIGHLMELYRLYKLDPMIASHCSWWEVQGLLLIDDAMRESGGKTCPRCRQTTTSLYNCETCGLRLN